VVLPAPFGPRIATNWPDAISRSMARSAGTLPVYENVTPARRIAGVEAGSATSPRSSSGASAALRPRARIGEGTSRRR
jgi:hypothetical protein